MQRHRERTTAIRRAVRRQTNRAREQAGLDSLTPNERLDEIASDYAETLGHYGELEHDVDGTTPQERASSFSRVGENLNQEHALHYDPKRTATATVRAWLDSDGHRQNLMRTTITRDGLGVYISGDMVYICHLLADEPTIGQKITARVGSLLSD